MKLSNWMAAKAVVTVIFGIGFVLMPGTLASIFGMSLDSAGALMAQLFGAAFIFESMVFWQLRFQPVSDEAARGVTLAVVVSNAIGFLVTLMATLNGVWNMLGWLPVGLYLVFGLGFAYFQFGRRAA